ncbi:MULTISPECIES: hypothetical protein [Paenibacillus]|uniref:hypothetical protein n=2 Tax=Paenibacillus TaxID=44249 RepID=UPI00096EF9CB|nr:hypothetical protein [Paenibacillus odorifer]OMC97691.1 hypothetical protein BJP46_25660 [Paenibacillus odorifer]OMD18096.1 hypothetical protein BJP50_15125 [Paenibacillus odorifer]
MISLMLLAVVIIGAVVLGERGGIMSKSESSFKSPAEPSPLIITHENSTDAIENYVILKTSWNGADYDRASFYYTAWHSEPTLLTGLRRLKPGEKMQVDFGDYAPSEVTVKMAYLTESFDESQLPIVEVPVTLVEGKYEFVNPPASTSDIPTSGRVFSVIARWGENICEYVFASDGKFDNYEYDL